MKPKPSWNSFAADRPMPYRAAPSPAALALEIPIASITERLDLRAIFGRSAPIEVDAGCGDGAFLCGSATRHPEICYLGIERLLGRTRKTCRRAAKANLANARVLRIETAYATRWLLPPASIRVFHILFPDPWPKRRHWPQRLIQPEFLRDVARVLEPAGELRIKTDDADYARWIARAISETGGFHQLPWPEESDEVRSDFEAGFLAKGIPIHRFRLTPG